MQGLPRRNAMTSPPTVYKNLVITGGTTQENPPKGPAGDVRAWNMQTGKLARTFRSIPRAGEKYNDSWAGDSWKNRTSPRRLSSRYSRRCGGSRPRPVRRPRGIEGMPCAQGEDTLRRNIRH